MTVVRRIMLGAIEGYRRYISPLKAPSCRFYPSCSQYALEAIQRHGALAGGYLAAARILRCHPLHPGGLDPVPNHPPRLFSLIAVPVPRRNKP